MTEFVPGDVVKINDDYVRIIKPLGNDNYNVVILNNPSGKQGETEPIWLGSAHGDRPYLIYDGRKNSKRKEGD